MNRSMIFCIVGLLLIGTNLYAANGDLIVGGNVAVGTTVPYGLLTLQKSGQMVNFLANQKLTGTWPAVPENTTFTIQSSGTAAGNLAFATGNSEIMRITAGGNVGIGTTNPGYKLDVAGDIRSSGTVSANNVIGNVTGNVAGNLTGNVTGNAISITANGGNISLGQTGAQQMIITTAGNVGIGTASPIRALQVNGELSLSRSDKVGFINVSDPNGNGGGTIILRGLNSNGSVGTNASVSVQGNLTASGTITGNGGRMGVYLITAQGCANAGFFTSAVTCNNSPCDSTMTSNITGFCFGNPCHWDCARTICSEGNPSTCTNSFAGYLH